MNRENDEPWSAAEIEEWEHDRWLKIQEMWKDFYKNEEKEEEMEEDPYEEDGKKKRKEQKKHISRR